MLGRSYLRVMKCATHRGGVAPCLAGDVVPNDLQVGGDAPHLLLLSGPNMGGKSTLLRQACVAAI